MYIDGFALVTGAAGGIGKDCAFAFAAEGAAGVAFADVNLEAAEEAAVLSKGVATNPNYRPISVMVDVANAESVDAMIADVIAKFGQIDYCVNSAGVGVQDPHELCDTHVGEFDRFYSINVRGTFLVTQAVSRQMKTQRPKKVHGRNGMRDGGRGSIVNLGSSNSFVATPHIIQYTTTKHAIIGLTRNAALDNAKYGIRVNAVCPAWTATPMVRAAIDGNPALGNAMTKVIPMGRIAEPEEVSDCVMFLASHRASFVTAAAWLVDGGATFCPTLGL